MNNRKTRNKRGARSREEWIQLASEPKKVKIAVGEGMEKQVLKLDNPRYGKMRRIIHKNFNKE